MNICYQCGEKMVTLEYYTSHQNEFATPPKYNHNEHIIQNALYGKLKPGNILCQQCGSDFSTDIDKDFVSLFTIITETIKHLLVKKDHGNDSLNNIKGYLYDDETLKQKIDVLIRGNQVAPKDPFHDYDPDNHTLYIYSNQIRAKQYLPLALKKLEEKNISTDNLKIDVVTDLSTRGLLGIFFSEGVENFNPKFMRGFCKIAVGFATYCGIPRDQLNAVLKIEADSKGKIVAGNNVFPFVPIGVVDSQIELNRPIIEMHYPSHTLIVFSQKFPDGRKRLFCYIDLFSTFQYYVLLNDDYKGKDVHQSYHQATAKVDVEPQNVRQTRPKYWNILADEFKIDTSKYKGNTLEEYADFLQAEINAYSFNPVLNLKEEVNRMMEALTTNFVLSQSKFTTNSITENLKAVKDKLVAPFLFELDEYFHDEEYGYTMYRNWFFEDDGTGKQLERMSSPIECLHYTVTQHVREVYCTMKFNQISKFIFDNKPAD